MKVLLCHMKWSKMRDIRVIKASKGSRDLQSLTVAWMQQSVELPRYCPCTGGAHGCVNTFAAQGLNFSSKESNNISVTETAQVCLGQVCAPSLAYFLVLPWLAVPCQFISTKFSPPSLPKHPG